MRQVSSIRLRESTHIVNRYCAVDACLKSCLSVPLCVYGERRRKRRAACTKAAMWKSGKSFQKLVFSFHCMGPSDPSKEVSLVARAFAH